jgi:hypothetical protein
MSTTHIRRPGPAGRSRRRQPGPTSIAGTVSIDSACMVDAGMTSCSSPIVFPLLRSGAGVAPID